MTYNIWKESIDTFKLIKMIAEWGSSSRIQIKQIQIQQIQLQQIQIQNRQKCQMGIYSQTIEENEKHLGFSFLNKLLDGFCLIYGIFNELEIISSNYLIMFIIFQLAKPKECSMRICALV